MKICELREDGMQDMRELAGLPRHDLGESVIFESKLSKEQVAELRGETVKNGVPVRFMKGGGSLDILTGEVFKGMNVMYQPVYWNFTKDTAKKVAKMLGARAQFSEDIETEIPVHEESEAEKIIKALADTDYRDKDAYFKLTQLIKGLAVASEEDDLANKFLSGVSDALTDVANKVLGEK